MGLQMNWRNNNGKTQKRLDNPREMWIIGGTIVTKCLTFRVVGHRINESPFSDGFLGRQAIATRRPGIHQKEGFLVSCQHRSYKGM